MTGLPRPETPAVLSPTHKTNIVTGFKQAADCLVPKIVKTQVVDADKLTSLGEGARDAFRIVRKDIGPTLRLEFDDFPCFGGIAKP